MLWSGITAASVLPFTEGGKIDWDSFESHLNELARHDLAGVLVNAETGEGPFLLSGEAEKVLRFAVKVVGERLPVIAGLFASHTQEAERLAARWADLGASGLLVPPPPQCRGVPLDPRIPLSYYMAVADSVDIPIAMYQTAVASGINLDSSTVRSIIDIEGIEAVKEGSWDWDTYKANAKMLSQPDAPAVLLADFDTRLVESVRLGAVGAMMGSAVILTEQFIRLWEWRETPVADEIQQAIQPLLEMIFASPFRDFRGRLKVLLQLDGIIESAQVRAPLRSISLEESDRLRGAMSDCREALRDVASGIVNATSTESRSREGL